MHCFLRHRIGQLAAVGLALAAAPLSAQAQQAILTGKVTTAAGAPLNVATVFIPELNIGAGVSNDGTFTLVIPATRVRGQSITLRARAIGFKPASNSITLSPGNQTFNFELAADPTNLSAVVVTGVSGATEQKRLPFAVTSIKVSDLPVPASNPLAQLQGRVPGANIVSSSGRPGSAPAVILRAPQSLFSGNDGQGPLIIVDGTVLNGTLADLSALDIETIEVVRGAAGASLYGARAGNGVINIITKSGRNAPEGARFSVRVESGVSDIERRFEIAQNHIFRMTPDGQRFCGNAGCTTSFDYVEELTKLNNSPSVVVPPPGVAPQVGGPWTTFQDQSWPGRTFDPIDAATTGGQFRNVDANVTGRNGGTSYYVSFNNFNQQSSIVGLNGFLRNTARVNVDQRLSSDLTISLRSQFTRSTQDGNNFDGGGPFFTLTRMPRVTDIAQRDTLGRRFVRIALDGENSNPLYELENNNFLRSTDRYLGSIDLNYTPTQWFTLNGKYAVDRGNLRDNNFRDKGFRTLRAGTTNEGTQSEGSSINQGINTSVTATARRQMGRFNTSLQGAWLYEQQDLNNFNWAGNSFAVGGIANGNNLLQPSLSVGNFRQSVRQISYNGIFDIDYDGKYILSAALRRDGASLFGEGNRWATFGRVAAAWRISDESWGNLPGVSDLKVRYSIGSAGQRPVFSAQYETFSVSGGNVSPQALGNVNLGVQTSVEQEYGVDLELLDKYTISVNRASNRIRDQIVNAPLAAATGFSNQWINAGVMRTNAWEVSVNALLVSNANMQWTVGGQWDQSFADIVDLPIPAYQSGPPQQGAEGMFFNRTGERLGTMYGFKVATQCGELPAAVRDRCGAEFATNSDGYLVYVGAGNTVTDGIAKNLWGTRAPFTLPAKQFRSSIVQWGAPIIAESETGETLQALGNTLPRFRYAVNSSFSYKRLGVYALLDASVGNKLYNLGRHWSYFENYSADQDQAGLADGDKKPVGYYGANTGLYNVLSVGSHFVEDASFAKLRELSLTYRVGRIGGFGGEWQAQLIGRNLLTFTNYTGFDPETGRGGGAGGSAVINGVDAFVFPNLRTFTFAIQTTF